MVLQKHVLLELLLIVTIYFIHLFFLFLFIFFLEFDITAGRAGYPLVSCEIRLVNWDEGQYKTTDKPNPRGEILIGGKNIAEGYFGEASKENVNFKEINGTRYFCTGDIGEVFPDGTFQIIGSLILQILFYFFIFEL